MVFVDPRHRKSLSPEELEKVEQWRGDWKLLTGEPFDPSTYAQLIHPDDRERVVAASAALTEGATFFEEYRVRGANGSYRWARGHAKAQQHAGVGVIVGRVVPIPTDRTHSCTRELCHCNSLAGGVTVKDG